MVDIDIHLTVPVQLKNLISKKFDQNEIDNNRIVLHTYKGRSLNIENKGEKVFEDKGEKVFEDKELYGYISDNFDWLLNHLGKDDPYEKLVSKFKTKIGHYLGVTSDYLCDNINFENDPDLKLDLEKNEKSTLSTQNGLENSSMVNEKNINNKNKRTRSEENDIEFDFNSITGDLKVFDNLKKILDTVPDAPDFKDTLMYQYMKPRSGPFIDTCSIEKKMFQHSSDKELIRLLKTAFEKSNLEDYIKLVKHFSIQDKKVGGKNIKSILSWKSWILNGFNLIFSGDGSNKNVLNTFSMIALRDGPTLTINAYTIKGSDSYLWNYLNDKIVGTKSTSKSEALKAITKKVKSLTSNFYMVIYGMDQFLLNDGFTTLKSLIQLKNVKVIGCINNQNSGPILNEFEIILGRYRLINTNTGEDYTDELISIWQNNPPNFLVNKKIQKSATQIQSILEALSQNHQKLFSLIAQIQMEHVQNNKKFIGIEKNSILQDNRAITICHNESKLDNLLTEFTTHDVIEQTRGPGGRLFLKIPFENNQLEHFVN